MDCFLNYMVYGCCQVYEGEWREDLRHGRGVQVIDAASKTRLLYGYVK